MFFKRIVLFLFILGGIFLSLWSCGDGSSDLEIKEKADELGMQNIYFENIGDENDLKYAPEMDILKCKARTVNGDDHYIQISGEKVETNADLKRVGGGKFVFTDLNDNQVMLGAVQSYNDPKPINTRFEKKLNKSIWSMILGSGNDMSHDTQEIIGGLVFKRGQSDYMFYAKPEGSFSRRPVGFYGIAKLDSYGRHTIDYTGLSDTSLSTGQKEQLEQLNSIIKNNKSVVFTNLVYRHKSGGFALTKENYTVRVNTFIPRDSILEVDIEQWDPRHEAVPFPDVNKVSVEVHYLVIPEGTYLLSGDKPWAGTTIDNLLISKPSRYDEYYLEVGTAKTTHKFTTVELQNDFTGGPPFIKVDWQSQVSLDPYGTNRVPRIRNIRIDNINNGHDSFEVKLDLPGGGTQYYSETVSYMALGAKNGDKSKVVEENGWLSVDYGKDFNGGALRSEAGDPVQLMGMSGFWPNWKDGGRLVNSSVIDWLVDKWGVTVYRLPIGVDPKDPKLITGKRIDQSGFIFEPEKRYARLCQIINYCIYKGIYIIVDWHIHDGLGKIEYEPGEEKSEYFEEGTKYEDIAAALFASLAKKYKNNPNVIFEIWNEPSKIDHLGDKPLIYWDGYGGFEEYADYVNQGTPEEEDDKDLKGYLYRIVPKIREQEKGGKGKHVIISPSGCWDQWIDQVQKITKYENIMYSFHFYAGSHLPLKKLSNGKYATFSSITNSSKYPYQSIANKAGLTDELDIPSIIINGIEKDGSLYQITQFDYNYIEDLVYKVVVKDENEKGIVDEDIYKETSKPNEVMLLWQLNFEPFNRLNSILPRFNMPVFATEWGTVTYDGGGVFPNSLDETAFGVTTDKDGYIYENGQLVIDNGQWVLSEHITARRLSIYPKSTKQWLRYFCDYGISWCNWSISDRHEGASMLNEWIAGPIIGNQTNVCMYGGWLDSDLTDSGKFMQKVFNGDFRSEGINGTK